MKPAGLASAPSPTTFPQPKTMLPDIAGPEEGFGLAMEAFKVGDQETAGLFAESVMERYPDTAWYSRSLFLLGRTLAARDMTSDAEAVLLRIPSEIPSLPIMPSSSLQSTMPRNNGTAMR